VPGNIVDVSTLSATINELNEYNINIDRAILDAGYYSKDNIILLYKNKIPFMTRLTEKNETFKLLVKTFVPNITCKENLVKFGDRTLFIKKHLYNFMLIQ
jgi:transposase